MAANVAVALDPAGNLKPAKDKSTERIDGIVASPAHIPSFAGRFGIRWRLWLTSGYLSRALCQSGGSVLSLPRRPGGPRKSEPHLDAVARHRS
jgi:hypothetical protein